VSSIGGPLPGGITGAGGGVEYGTEAPPRGGASISGSVGDGASRGGMPGPTGEGHCASALPANKTPSSSEFLKHLERINSFFLPGCPARAHPGVLPVEAAGADEVLGAARLALVPAALRTISRMHLPAPVPRNMRSARRYRRGVGATPGC
jgi:hypothetical protein